MIADLSGKTAIITGGGQGLGLGISTKIAGQGANIIITDLDDRNKSTVEELARTNNVDFLYLEMDVMNSEQVAESMKKAIDFSKEVYIFLKYGSFLFPKEFILVWFKPMVKFRNFKKTFSFCSFCNNFSTSFTSLM